MKLGFILMNFQTACFKRFPGLIGTHHALPTSRGLTAGSKAPSMKVHARKQKLLAVFFCLLFPAFALAEVAVVDDSDNFTVVEAQQVDEDYPLAEAQIDDSDDSEERAIAIDNNGFVSNEVPSGDNYAKLLEQIQRLQSEIQELRGQLEVQDHDLALLKKQQVAFYQDLDARLSDGSTPKASSKMASIEVKPEGPQVQNNEKKQIKPVALMAAPSSNTGARVNPADEQISYLAAYDLIKNKRFDDAIKAMKAFVAQYPKGGYSGNAYYWLGELYLVKNDYAQAIAHFETVLKAFPSSSKSAASLLKMGYALAASGKTTQAISCLQQVVKKYPDTSTAQLATVKLELLESL